MLLNEVAGAAGTFWVEVVNATAQALDASGWAVSSPSGGGYAFPPGTVIQPGGLAAVWQADLGIDPWIGDKVFLYPPDRAEVADGVEVAAQPRARAGGGDPRWLYPDTATPGQPNAVVLEDAVVINEVMYHHGPVPQADGSVQSSGEEWIELYNRGDAPVDLSGWQVVDATEFTVPAGTVLPPGGYVVLARGPVALAAAHPGIAVAGNLDGKLPNEGGRILLLDACGNPADSVRWHDGGRWPALADGGRSSLELKDPRADNSAPEAWAASDESAAAAWQQYSFTGVAAASAVGPDGRWHEFVTGLLDDGVVLLDDVSVVEDPGGAALERIQDGTFETGTAAGWRLLGNHRHSAVVADPDDPGNRVLRLVATGMTEHMHNHAETTLAGGAQIQDGKTYRISFRARWVAGSNQLNTRLYFNRLARTTLLPVPLPNGTPGRPNSAAVGNLGPTYAGFEHVPAVPAAQAPVPVSVVASDPDGVASVVVRYRADGGPWQSAPMADEAGGRFTGLLPGQAAGTVVQLYVEGTDGLGAATAFPAGGAASRALYQVDDGLAGDGVLHDLRIVMLGEDSDWLFAPANLMSNDYLGATVVLDEREVFHDVGVRLKGSERGRPMPKRVGFAVRFRRDQAFRGVFRSVMVDRSEGVNYGQREILIDQVMNRAGSVHSKYDDLVRVNSPRDEYTGAAMLQIARFEDIFLDAQFVDGSDGTLFEYELIYYPTTTDTGTPEGYKLPQPDLVVGTPIRDLGPDKEAYRYSFILKGSRWRDDYGRLMEFAAAFGKTGAEFDATVANFIDVDEWLRAFAFATVSGAVDNYASGAQHNAFLYVRPVDQRVLYFPHDLDFYQGNPNTALIASPDLAKLVASPSNMRKYYGHLNDITAAAYNPAYLAPWCAHLGALLPGQDFASHCAWMAGRSAWVTDGATNSVNKAVPKVAFEIGTNGGADLTVPEAALTLSGTGWVDVDTIRRSGESLPIDALWDGLTAWHADVALACGPNAIVLEAVDLHGRVVGTDAIVVTSTAAGCS